ncbi:hypothetical protein MAR_011336 [Mya arenaria]|uniref:Uncharacterized protein n=1 Tax=Mya arenaria TaxID=6604 RepID=A0ABY7FX65_MYAAR|nr:hypothetical protein MAR_011336 [Mya arenaria]
MEILVGILVLIATCRADYSLLEVANKCGSTIDIDDSVEILYSGDPISGVCKITFETGETFDNICVMSQEFNVDSRFRDVTVQYHGAYYSSFSPDKRHF